MHHQAAQKTTELLQYDLIVLIDMAIIEHIVVFRAGRGEAMVNTIKTNRYADYHGNDGQRIQECRKEGGGNAKCQRQQHLGANRKQ